MPGARVVEWRAMLLASDLPSAAKVVGVALGDRMDPDSLDGARPGLVVLMRSTGLAKTTVKRALRTLEIAGVITQTHRGGWEHSVGNVPSSWRGVLRSENA
jgi:hypothetical protein